MDCSNSQMVMSSLLEEHIFAALVHSSILVLKFQLVSCEKTRPWQILLKDKDYQTNNCDSYLQAGQTSPDFVNEKEKI